MTEAPRKFSAIAVYCGSNVGKGEVYQQAAQRWGRKSADVASRSFMAAHIRASWAFWRMQP